MRDHVVKVVEMVEGRLHAGIDIINTQIGDKEGCFDKLGN